MKPPLYYRALIKILAPLYHWYLRHQRATVSEISDRFEKHNDAPFADGARVIWCHAVSLGELNTAQKLLTSLLDDGYCLYITSTTKTGHARVKVLFADAIVQKKVAHGFVPVDAPKVLQAFLARIKPSLALFVETELWGNTLYALHRCNIPAVMINARLVDRSFLRYQKFTALSQSMMQNISFVVAQDDKTAQNFLALGLPPKKLTVCDSLKWGSASALSKALADEYVNLKPKLAGRFVWVAASTHDGEELAAILAHKRLLSKNNKALLIIVPRHPERFDAVFALCQQHLPTARESLGEAINKHSIFLADSMGRLLLYYKLSDVAFVGGSLVNKGGHTPIEPAFFAKPMIMGGYINNAKVLVDALMPNALTLVHNANDLFLALMNLQNTHTRQIQGDFAKQMVLRKQNAHLIQKQYLLPFLPPMRSV